MQFFKVVMVYSIKLLALIRFVNIELSINIKLPNAEYQEWINGTNKDKVNNVSLLLKTLGIIHYTTSSLQQEVKETDSHETGIRKQ